MTAEQELLPFRSEFGGRTYPQKPHWSEGPQLHWASAVIAKLHRSDAISGGGAWDCPCRSCELVRGELAARGPR